MKIQQVMVAVAFVLAMFMSAGLSTPANAQAPRNSPAKRVKGTVKWFNDAKGIGYLTSEAGTDIFYTKDSANGHTIESECVTFEIRSSPKGPTARNVRGCPGIKPPTAGPIPFPAEPKP